MSPNFIQEQLSWAYVRAVIFRAGYNLYFPAIDDHGVDAGIASYEGRRSRIDFQLKATTQYTVRSSSVIYDLRVENYNQLAVSSHSPRVLILFTMPANDNLWLSQNHNEMCLRGCAYWASLAGMPPSRNTSTVRVSLPMANIFDADGLSNMFSQLHDL